MHDSQEAHLRQEEEGQPTPPRERSAATPRLVERLVRLRDMDIITTEVPQQRYRDGGRVLPGVTGCRRISLLYGCVSI